MEHRRDRDVDERIGRNVRVMLAAQGRKALDLIPVLRVSESMISRRLNGHQPISASEVAAIADFLGVEPGILYMPTDELVRIRCFYPIHYEGQGELSFEPPADLMAV